jgi:hypothetical protein
MLQCSISPYFELAPQILSRGPLRVALPDPISAPIRRAAVSTLPGLAVAARKLDKSRGCLCSASGRRIADIVRFYFKIF